MKQQVELVTDLRTAGGEVLDVMVEDRYAGSLYLVYREGDRLSGSLQIEKEPLGELDEQMVTDKIHAYVRSLATAIEAVYYEVLVSIGTLHSVLQSLDSRESALYEDMYLDEQYQDHSDSVEVRLIPEAQSDTFTYEDPDHLLEMEMVSAGRNISTYVFNDADGQEVAEASLKQIGADAQGEIHWYDQPGEVEQEAAAELLVRELDEDVIDTITIRMWHQGVELETLEWLHRDFADEMDEEEDEDLEDYSEVEEEEEACYVVLKRKDRDFRVYELFVQERGGLPVGTATIDISHSELSGYIDYEVPGTSMQRKTLVELLMYELDKEIEFDSLHITMLYRNQIIDEARMEG